MNDYHCFQTIQNSFHFDSTELFSCCSFVHDESNFLQILVYIDEDQRTVRLQQKEESKIKELQRKKKYVLQFVCHVEKQREAETNLDRYKHNKSEKNTQLQCKLPKYWTRKQFRLI